MKKVLILGASGSLAKVVISVLLDSLDIELTLFSRHINQLRYLSSETIKVIQGDVMILEQLEQAMQGQAIVYANLAGELCSMATNIIQTMNKQKLKRLIWVSSMGIYNETDQDHGTLLDPYRFSAQIIEQSHLDYTIIRPAWFTNGAEIDYKLTRKGDHFQGHQVSRRSIAALIKKLIQKPDYAIRESLGIAKV